MKNGLISKCVEIIDGATVDDVFVSKESSDNFYTATINLDGNTATLLYSEAHSIRTLSVDNNKVDLEKNEFDSIKNLISKKNQTN